MKKLTFFLLCFLLISSNSTSNNYLSYDIAILKVEKIEKDVNRKSWFWNDWDYDMILNHTYSFPDIKKLNSKIVKERHFFYGDELWHPEVWDIIVSWVTDKRTENWKIIAKSDLTYYMFAEKIYFVTCHNDNFYDFYYDLFDVRFSYVEMPNWEKVSNWKTYNYDIENWYIDYYTELPSYEEWFEKIGLTSQNIKKTLKEKVKTCRNFEKMFDINLPKKLNFRFREDYKKTKIEYLKKLRNYFFEIKEIIDKLDPPWDYVPEKYFQVLEKIRERVDSNPKYSEEKKYRLNVALDALKYF